MYVRILPSHCRNMEYPGICLEYTVDCLMELKPPKSNKYTRLGDAVYKKTCSVAKISDTDIAATIYHIPQATGAVECLRSKRTPSIFIPSGCNLRGTLYQTVHGKNEICEKST